jgi:sugar phosphate isomerase/epimerase
LDKVLDRVQAVGFDGLELLGMAPHGDPDAFASASDRKSLLRKFRDRGLSISNYGADFHGKSPASNDPRVRQEYLTLFEKNLRFCVDLEIPSIRVDTVDEPPLPKGVASTDCWQRFVDAWQGCSEKAEEEGVLVVWEFEPGFAFNRPGEITRMVREVSHRNFKILFDSCHAHMCASVGARQEKPAETLPKGELELARVLRGSIGYVHLIDSDNTLHDGWTSTHAPFGAGVIDFDALVRAIVAAGYDGDWWTVDLCFWPGAWDILQESRDFVGSLLKRNGLLEGNHVKEVGR